MSREDELISVIIPTYKRNDTLVRAINSVKNQTYKNIEIIVVDDNAKFLEIREKNKEIIKKYDDIIFIENKENLGGGISRNVGIQRATGKFIAFLDDDDEFYPNKLEEQFNYYKKLNNDNIAMIYCYAKMVNVDGSTYFFKKNIEGNLLKENVENCIAATSWWFCPKDKLLSVGGFEDISSRQDASLLLKFFLKGYEVYCVQKILLKYYWHDSNNGISKIDYKSIEAEKKYRDIFLNNSENIKEQEKREILYYFSYRLSNLYILLNCRKEAMKELITMLKIKKITLKNFKIFIGICFNKLYCIVASLKNRRRFCKR